MSSSLASGSQSGETSESNPNTLKDILGSGSDEDVLSALQRGAQVNPGDLMKMIERGMAKSFIYAFEHYEAAYQQTANHYLRYSLGAAITAEPDKEYPGMAEIMEYLIYRGADPEASRPLLSIHRLAEELRRDEPWLEDRGHKYSGLMKTYVEQRERGHGTALGLTLLPRAPETPAQPLPVACVDDGIVDTVPGIEEINPFTRCNTLS